MTPNDILLVVAYVVLLVLAGIALVGLMSDD